MIDHEQQLTDKVEEQSSSVVGETAAPRRGVPFFLSKLFSPIPEKLLMQTQAEECVDMADLLPDSFKLRQLKDGAPQGGAGVAAGGTCASGGTGTSLHGFRASLHALP